MGSTGTTPWAYLRTSLCISLKNITKPESVE